MATRGQVVELTPAKTQVLQVFISYAREDENIAQAIEAALRTALGSFSNVFRDNALQFGLHFQDEIKERLDHTDLLVVISSGAMREAHSFPGMELGYFMGTMAHGDAIGRPRRIVPIYLDAPPAPAADIEGIQIGISRSTLALALDEYDKSLVIDKNDPMVRFLIEFQELADKYADAVRQENGLPKTLRTAEQQDLCGLVRKMQLFIFSQLKTKPESTLKPQRQITIKTTDSALESSQNDLPPETQLIPMGGGSPLTIFGLPNEAISWDDFCRRTSNSKFNASWIDAIATVVRSSLQNQLQVDNSQLIVSDDGQQNVYRVILTTSTHYFNGVREFNLYFVEYLQPKDYGDTNTTMVLKGLELSCRFRSLFLERNSEFHHVMIRMKKPGALVELVRDIERELNLLHRDAIRMGLDKANVWSDFVDWKQLLKLSQDWTPLDKEIRDCCAGIRKMTDDPGLPRLQESLADTLEKVENVMRPLNTELICELTENLKKFCSCP
jgi:hypothetical protein